MRPRTPTDAHRCPYTPRDPRGPLQTPYNAQGCPQTVFTYLHYTQSPFIRTGPIRLGAEFWGKFKTRALGSSNLRTTSKNLRTASSQIFKAKNRVLLPFLTYVHIFHLYIHKFKFFSISLFLFLSVNITECETEFFVFWNIIFIRSILTTILLMKNF